MKRDASSAFVPLTTLVLVDSARAVPAHFGSAKTKPTISWLTFDSSLYILKTTNREEAL
jgi:hypothetical protein